MDNHTYLAVLLLLIAVLHTSWCQLEANNITETDDVSIADIMEEKADMEEMEAGPMFMGGKVNCLGLSRNIYKIFHRLFQPHSEKDVNVQFFLTTRKVREWTKIPTDPEISFEGLDFDANRFRTIFIVHGFLSRAMTAGWVEDMATALLEWDNVNVIIVDWNSSWKYWRAIGNTRVVGAALTKLGFYLMGVMKADAMKFHLIGHSLGAHIVSFMSACLGGVARITGLDPASPCFQGDDYDNKLDKSDALFVDIIHTNGRVLKKLGLGQPHPIGHVDFYPNGGMIQPGCANNNSFFSRIPLLSNKLKRAICSHGRSYEFFIEGIRHNCTFWGHKWNMEEDKDAKNTDYSSCNLDTCTEMGMLSEEFPSRGIFFVKTREKVPFCKPNNMVDKRMGRLLGARSLGKSEAEPLV